MSESKLQFVKKFLKEHLKKRFIKASSAPLLVTDNACSKTWRRYQILRRLQTFKQTYQKGRLLYTTDQGDPSPVEERKGLHKNWYLSGVL